MLSFLNLAIMLLQGFITVVTFHKLIRFPAAEVLKIKMIFKILLNCVRISLPKFQYRKKLFFGLANGVLEGGRRDVFYEVSSGKHAKSEPIFYAVSLFLNQQREIDERSVSLCS